ncbi:MAG: Nre family DNA repair protein [Candidatus Hydrothermarchaeota archaeon]
MVSPQKKNLCIVCKGSRLLCGRSSCSILSKIDSIVKFKHKFTSKEIFGSSPPSAFVGYRGYPRVYAGPMVPPVLGDTSILDMTERWFGLSVQEIIDFRSQLLRTQTLADVKKPSKILDAVHEIVLASKPVDTEIKLAKEPRFRMSFSDYEQPMGPSAPLISIKVTENPKIPRHIEKITSDIDLKADKALIELYDHDIPVSHLVRIFSVGLLGKESKRKLVPTRWAITAVDDIVSKNLIRVIKDFPLIDSYQVFYSDYLDNRFFILLIPTSWCFEQLEAWFPESIWSCGTTSIVSDHEFYRGRSDYASNVTGAYYAGRLAVCEHLVRRRRQAGVIIFREIHKGYYIPLGVWQIRENVRNAMKNGPITFEDLKGALDYISSRLKIPMEKWESQSHILRYIKKQRSIFDFF